ncbi:MAG: hypothetical protein ACRBBT_10415 [Paracoccaceae bacterium]
MPVVDIAASAGFFGGVAAAVVGSGAGALTCADFLVAVLRAAGAFFAAAGFFVVLLLRVLGALAILIASFAHDRVVSYMETH